MIDVVSLIAMGYFDAMRKSVIHTLRMTRYMKGGRTLFSFRLDPSVVAALDRVAERLRRSRTESLEQAAREFAERHGETIHSKAEDKSVARRQGKRIEDPPTPRKKLKRG